MAKRDGLANVIRRGDVLEPHQRALIGDAWQLRWAVPDAITARKTAAILRDFANKLEVWSQPPRGMSEYEAMNQQKAARDEAQRRLQSIRKPFKNKSAEINR